MVQGPGVDWQRPASWFFSTPRFLAAQRSAVSSRREEIAVVALAAQHNTRVCGPLCDPSGSSQAIPSLLSASTVFASTLALVCNCIPVCRIFNDQTAEQQTYSLSPPQGIFALQKSLRRVGFHKFVVPPTSNHSKVRTSARLAIYPHRAALGCQRDRGPSVWERVQRKPFPRVFFGQLLPGGSTRRFFAQLRSVGSKKNQLAGLCQTP